MPMPPNPENLALQSALGGEDPAMEEGGGGDQELQILMQLIDEVKRTGDPKIMALLEQLVSLQQPMGGAEPPME